MDRICLHSHTSLCPHGHDSLADMVDAAESAGIALYAITEHYPVTPEIDPRDFVSMKPADVPVYLEQIERARLRHPRMELLAGCELDWLGADEDRDFAPGEFERFDVVLGSVHFIDRWALDDPAGAGLWDELGADAIWRRYFQVWCEAASSAQAPFNVMAHPDLVKKYGHRPSFDPRTLYKAAAEAVAGSGRMVEVNTSGMWHPCGEMYPAPDLLREFCRAGVPCTLGTDAHRAAHVARGIEEGYKLMYEAGYREVTIPTHGGERRAIAL